MKKVFYYTPIIETIANNGSERFGAKANTKMWHEDNPSMKLEVTMSGKSIEESKQKLLNFLSSNGENEAIELLCNYYLCSKAVIDFFKPFYVSKPFKSGYEYDKDDENFVAWLNFEDIEKHYNEVVEPYNSNLDAGTEIDFSANECVPGQIDVSKINLKDAKKSGFWIEIEKKIGLTKENNRAMTIFNLSEREGITPIELINKIANYGKP